MSKGKEHKRYEFGAKASITTMRDSKVVVGAMAFPRSRHDNHTLPDVLLQLKRLTGSVPAVRLGVGGAYKCAFM